MKFNEEENGYEEYANVPVESGKYKVILTYNSLSTELEYEITNGIVNPKTSDGSGVIITIYLCLLLIIGIIMCLIRKNENIDVSL